MCDLLCAPSRRSQQRYVERDCKQQSTPSSPSLDRKLIKNYFSINLLSNANTYSRVPAPTCTDFLHFSVFTSSLIEYLTVLDKQDLKKVFEEVTLGSNCTDVRSYWILLVLQTQMFLYCVLTTRSSEHMLAQCVSKNHISSFVKVQFTLVTVCAYDVVSLRCKDRSVRVCKTTWISLKYLFWLKMGTGILKKHPVQLKQTWLETYYILVTALVLQATTSLPLLLCFD